MLNLPEVAVKIGKKKDTGAAPKQCTVLYQTTECFRLLEEALLYEGMEPPAGRICTDDNLTGQLTDVQSSLVFIECHEACVEKAKAIKHLVGRQVMAVLVGWEDKMSVAREIEELGFYYLLWPARKDDIISLLHHVSEDLNRNYAPNHARSAMRVGVVGLKGGSGCTLITAELAYGLARESQQQVILVDHGYTGSNMHIMLGKRDLARSKMTGAMVSHHSLGNSLDHVTVQSQLAIVEQGIHYLGLESDTLDPNELYEYNNRVLMALAHDANFILEDYSASVKFYPHPKELCTVVDCVVMVVQPTLSGLHESKLFLEQFRDINPGTENPARLIIVLNHNTEGKQISLNVAEEFLGQPVDIELPYCKNAEEFLISGKRFIDGKTRLTGPFLQLSRQILGKQSVPKSFFSKWFRT